MSNAYLPIIPVSVPQGWCPPGPNQWQSLLNKFAESQVLLSAGNLTVVVRGNSTPAATDRDKLWYKDDDDNGVHLYHWDATAGHWVSRHGELGGGDGRRVYIGSTTALKSYDGGDGTDAIPVLAQGAMWEVDTNFTDRFLFGAGDTAVNVQAGSNDLSLTQANLPNIQLSVSTGIVGHPDAAGADGIRVVGNPYGGDNIPGSGRFVDSSSTELAGRYYTKGQTEALGSGTAVDIRPARVGVYIIKRTGRLYYRGD